MADAETDQTVEAASLNKPTFLNCTNRPRILFALLVALQVACSLVMILRRRMPNGHDGFQYFTLQYYFLNNAVQSGEVAQWMPYMTHGTIATWWYTASAGLLQSVLVHLGPLIAWTNPLVLTHLGILVDEIFLLTGTWLLARRFSPHPETAFYVCICELGSCAWINQPWFNLHFYYCIPLMLHFGHRFLETGKWRYFLAAGNLLAVQTIGNLPYFIPMTTFILASYFGLFAMFNFRQTLAGLKRIRLGLPAIISLALVVTGIFVAYAILKCGVNDLAIYNVGREQDGTVSLHTFLTYADNTNLLKWNELWLAIPEYLDFTLYLGFLAVPLTAIGIVWVRRDRLHFVVLAAIILAISVAFKPVAVPLYYLWPGMKYYRHLALVSPCAKLMLGFVAGIGFERIFMRRNSRTSVIAANILAVVLIAFSLVMYWSVLHAGVIAQLLRTFLPRRGLIRNPYFMDSSMNCKFLFTAAFAFGIGVILAVRQQLLTARKQRLILAGVLLLAAADLFYAKLWLLHLRSDTTTSVPELVQYAKFRFVSQREIPDITHSADNPRLKMLARLNADHEGSRYWTTDSFVMRDQPGSLARVDNWLRPLDRLMRAYLDEPVLDESQPPRALSSDGALNFPLTYPSSRKVVGLDENRVQFFDRAWAAPSDPVTAAWLTDRTFAGDGLLLNHLPNQPLDLSAEDSPATPPLASNHRLHLRYEVRQFDANNTTFFVQNPTGKKAWLLYCDVWNPAWSATVNGMPSPVIRADLAYKAVVIEPGDNTVHFRFAMPRFSFLAGVFAANAAIWIAVVGWMMGSILRDRSNRAPVQ